MTESHSDVRAPQPDPFAFPSDTDFRFVLLIVAVLGASLFIYKWFVPSTQQTEAAVQCLITLQAMQARQGNALAPMDDFRQCGAHVAGINSAWMVGGTALVLALAALIYWVLPSWKIRHGKLVPLSADDAPEVVTSLADLCREAGLAYAPTFLWNPLNPAVSGLAFGRRGRYYVAITGGLVTQYYTDQAAFRAVILHELAHLRNADVDKTYFTVTVWWAFVIAALVPFTVYLVGKPIVTRNWPGLKQVPLLGWRVFALAALVYLTRNAVLRAREFYADVRASRWDGADGLARVVAALPQPTGGWRGMLLVHPSTTMRCKVLQDTRGLFRLGFWEALGLGIAAAIALPNVQVLLLFLWVVVGRPLQSAATQTEIAVLVVTSLAVGAAGLSIWRAAFAARARSEPLRGAGRVGLCIGLGLVIGQVLSFERFLEDLVPTFWVGISARRLPWDMLALPTLFLVTRWIAAGALTWLDVVPPGRSLRLAYSVGLMLASLALALCLGNLLTLRDVTDFWLQRLSFANAFPLISVYIFGAVVNAFEQPGTLLIVVSLWAFPLAAGLWRNRETAGWRTSWSFQSAAPEEDDLPQPASLRPRLALTIGLGSGLAFWALLLAMRVALRFGLSEVTRSTGTFKITFFIVQIVLAVLIQAGAAALVAGWVKRVSVVHGLFAAFTAGCMTTVGILGLNLLFGGTVDSGLVWLTLSESVIWGALAAVLVAGATSALAGWVRHARLQPVPA